MVAFMGLILVADPCGDVVCVHTIRCASARVGIKVRLFGTSREPVGFTSTLLSLFGIWLLICRCELNVARYLVLTSKLISLLLYWDGL